MKKILFVTVPLVVLLAGVYFALTPKVMHRFDYPMAVVELTDTPCLIDEPHVKDVPGVKGGIAKHKQKDEKRQVCWVQKDTIVFFIDETGDSGAEEVKK
jgi:hypothetical protein